MSGQTECWRLRCRRGVRWLVLAAASWSVFGVAAKAEPIKLHPENPHYLLWRGKAAILITSGEHYGAVLNSTFDYKKYLATLESHGFNLTRTFSGAYCEPPGAFSIKRNTLAPVGKIMLLHPCRIANDWDRPPVHKKCLQ